MTQQQDDAILEILDRISGAKAPHGTDAATDIKELARILAILWREHPPKLKVDLGYEGADRSVITPRK